MTSRLGADATSFDKYLYHMTSRLGVIKRHAFNDKALVVYRNSGNVVRKTSITTLRMTNSKTSTPEIRFKRKIHII